MDLLAELRIYHRVSIGHSKQLIGYGYERGYARTGPHLDLHMEAGGPPFLPL